MVERAEPDPGIGGGVEDDPDPARCVEELDSLPDGRTIRYFGPSHNRAAAGPVEGTRR